MTRLGQMIYDDGLAKGIEQGIEKGTERGAAEKLAELVVRKIKKGYQPEETAEMLEEDLELIKKIYAAAQKAAPEYDLKEICQSILE